MLKKIICLVALSLSSISFAQDSVNREAFDSLMSNRGQTTEAVCKYETRCGFKTACTWACIALSTAPMGKWWKTYAVAVGAKYCGDLCEKVEECKYGYYCDAY